MKKRDILQYLALSVLFLLFSFTIFNIPFMHVISAVLLVLAANKMSNPLNKKYTLISLIMLAVTIIVNIFVPIIFKTNVSYDVNAFVNGQNISYKELLEYTTEYLSKTLVPSCINAAAGVLRVFVIVFIVKNYELFADDRVFNGGTQAVFEMKKITKKYMITSIITEVLAIAVIFLAGFFLKELKIDDNGNIVVDSASLLSIPLIIASIAICVVAIMSLIYYIKLIIRLFNFKSAYNNVGDEEETTINNDEYSMNDQSSNEDESKEDEE